MLRKLEGRYSQRVKRALSARGRRMARARWAKWRAEAANRPEPEPKMQRYYPLEYGVRVKATGETHFRELVSVRQAAKALGMILKYY